MKPRRLWKISVAISTEAEDAVLDLLQRHFTGSPAVYSDSKTGKTTVGLYLTRPPDHIRDQLVLLKRGLLTIRRCGLQLGSGRVNVSRIEPQNWAESWKHHFHPMIIGGRLLIKPSWIKHKPHPGQAVVELDPGLSFGTGHHPTTRFCLQELVRYRPRREPRSCLDVGTGSGILAIAAAKLTFRPVKAIDVDEDAVRIARVNASCNGVSNAIQILRQDLGKRPLRSSTPFDLICANLSEDLLLDHQRALLRRLAAGGRLVLAGIARARFARVEEAYRRAGLVMLRSVQSREWQSGTFSFKALRVQR